MKDLKTLSALEVRTVVPSGDLKMVIQSFLDELKDVLPMDALEVVTRRGSIRGRMQNDLAPRVR